MLCEVYESGFPLKYSKKLLSWSQIIIFYLSRLPGRSVRMSARGAATVTSISGPPDGRLTGPLASGTPDGDVRCWDSRLIDQKTRWWASMADLQSHHATSVDDALRELAATVTSISGPPDGRLTGPLASDTSAGDMRC